MAKIETMGWSVSDNLTEEYRRSVTSLSVSPAIEFNLSLLIFTTDSKINHSLSVLDATTALHSTVPVFLWTDVSNNNHGVTIYSLEI